MSSYNYSYTTAAAMSPMVAIISLALTVVLIIAMWRIFEKAGEPGWACLVPIYSSYVLFKITWGNGIYFLLCLIPVINFVVLLMTYHKLSKAFGHGIGFTLGLIFISPIFFCLLGFGNEYYSGVSYY